MNLDPSKIHAAISAVLTSTPAIPVWSHLALVGIEPLTVEEAAVLAPVITTAVLSVITEGA